MTNDLHDVDIRLMLARLRPGSAYTWRGGSGYEAIGDWRDPATNKPTPAEIRAAWDTYRQEQETATTRRRARLERLEVLRQDQQGDEIDLAPYQNNPALLRLAQKIAWMEAELRALLDTLNPSGG